ncbi:MAG: HAD family hydrolase [Prevotella sp.]|nr:HAD family hydrolase [Prevotella sp.]
MIKGYIFDYGGTLDTAGTHWGKVLWHAYQNFNIPISEALFRQAYVHAERLLGANPVIKPDFSFYKTLDIKLRLEMEFLMTEGYWNASEDEYVKLHDNILNSVYNGVKNTAQHSRSVINTLSLRYPMVLVSNFYGNIHQVLKEFALDNFFASVIESADVGIRKPDPRIFSLGVKALCLKPDEVRVVGDSFYKDIIPAKKAGCYTAWLKGEGWNNVPYDETIPDMIITDIAQLLI